MKDLIKKIFKDILNEEVRVIEIEEESIEYAVFLHPESYKDKDDKELSTFAWDYALCSVEETDLSKERNKIKGWMYMVMVHDQGNRETPPSSDPFESKLKYKRFNDALRGLVSAIVDDKMNDLFEWYCYEKSMEEIEMEDTI